MLGCGTECAVASLGLWIGVPAQVPEVKTVEVPVEKFVEKIVQVVWSALHCNGEKSCGSGHTSVRVPGHASGHGPPRMWPLLWDWT